MTEKPQATTCAGPSFSALNRDHDHMQGLFETAYQWAREAGINPEHVSYDVHGYVLRVKQDESGAYHPDEIQLKAIQQAVDFFNRHMRPAR